MNFACLKGDACQEAGSISFIPVCANRALCVIIYGNKSLELADICLWVSEFFIGKNKSNKNQITGRVCNCIYCWWVKCGMAVENWQVLACPSHSIILIHINDFLYSTPTATQMCTLWLHCSSCTWGSSQNQLYHMQNMKIFFPVPKCSARRRKRWVGNSSKVK